MSELVYLEFGATLVEYREGWDLQRRVHARRVVDEVPDSCLLLEHEPVYTAGKRTAASDRPFGDPGAPVIDVDRGGKITWHGPGQLTGYPVIKLREPLDVVAYVRALEEAMIRTCAEFGVSTGRVAGRSGAWVPGDENRPDRKVGAIGARVARGVTMHGFALNADCDLSWYDRIVPCGIRDAGTTTLSAETGRDVTVAELRERYHAVVYAIGTATDNRLGIPGEDRPGSLPATEFVAWYNGHPHFTDHRFDLHGGRAVVIGNGNVAIDVARMLVLEPGELAVTDTADHAIDALGAASVQEVVLLGRRGPAQAAVTHPRAARARRARAGGRDHRSPRCGA